MTIIDQYYDCTGEIGPLYACDAPPAWPMYSFERPARILWNAIATNLHKRNWSDAQIREWLCSKATRWALDGSLGEELEALGDKWATRYISQTEAIP